MGNRLAGNARSHQLPSSWIRSLGRWVGTRSKEGPAAVSGRECRCTWNTSGSAARCQLQAAGLSKPSLLTGCGVGLGDGWGWRWMDVIDVWGQASE